MTLSVEQIEAWRTRWNSEYLGCDSEINALCNMALAQADAGMYSEPTVAAMIAEAVEAEREACAKIVEERYWDRYSEDEGFQRHPDGIAAIIRARGEPG